MKTFNKLHLFSFLILFSVFNLAQAANAVVLVNAEKEIQNLNKVLAEAKSKIHYTQSFSDRALPTSSFVAFPLMIPKASTKMFASLELTDNAATINIDSTVDCKGAKFCNLAHLTFQASANPTIYYDRDNKQATSAVKLNKNIEGFYSRGFAMADYSPANMQWRDKEILYTLSWNIEDKAIFVKMANSIIDQLSRTS